ncbi:MAG: hypothetical protein KAU17_16660, partial [Spirochaetales bacterium]|nr:hypothetical protein [Spirochaetales bacterium]
LDDSGNSTQVEYTFAAYINEELFHPSRKGGDSYFLVPRGGTIFESGKIGVIQESLSESTDINGGVSLGIALSGSSNEGSSLCYTDLFDINGDRYPDLVQFDEKGSNIFSVLPGTGSGFGNKIPYSSPYQYITTSGNNAIGLGASVGSSNGSMENRFSPGGKVEGVQIGLVKPPSGFGSIGVNGTLGESFQSIGFRDLNGDGLPDHVSRGKAGTAFAVLLNTGTTTFANSVTWGNGMNVAIHQESFTLIDGDTQGLSGTNNGSFGASVSGCISPVSVSGGFNATVNKTNFSLIDMNGDGLPDQVVKRDDDDYFLVKFNLGDTFSENTVKLFRPSWDKDFHGILAEGINEALKIIDDMLDELNLKGGSLPVFSQFNGENAFEAIIDPFSIQDTIHYSTGVGFNLGANITFTIPLWFLILKIIPGVNGSYATTSATLQMQDINGDGLPDHVLKIPGEEFVRVKLNGIGKTGLLKSISLPMGGSYEIDYERTRNTVAMPQSRYVLSSVTRNDGFEEDPEREGEHSYTDRFTYQGGYYDRNERAFYGFREVRIERGDESVRTNTYNNSDYHKKGQLSSTVLEDSQGNIYQETFWQYEKRYFGPYPSPAKEVVFPAVVKEITKHYDPQTGESLETVKNFDFDGYGNITWMHDEGSTSDPDDDLEMEITYSYPGGSLYLRQLPEEIEVKDANGELLRRRRGYYDTCGNLNRLRQYWDDYDYGEYDLSYNKYGNITRITDPRGYTLE